ncbi:FabD/lysophospholipase-like protein, partial [Lepidopterella palustris CBS 459.81]
MPSKELRLLALDGGGIRGLSSLMILEQLMQTIDPDSPPKPCDYFDMIAGTSTGGLIAIMLGRLKMSIDECIDSYISLSDRVFQKKRHRVTVKGNIQGRFDSEELARAVKEIVTKQGLQEGELLKDSPDTTCKVFVCATSKQTSETVCLTSYRSPRGGGDLLNTVKIWEACRATSAASSFFDNIAIGRYQEEFIDGATGANNPVWELWNQAQLIWGPEPLENNVKCLVSVGTGVPSLKPFRDDVFHIGETLVAIATETEQTAERFRRDKSHLDNSGRYYRFNVTSGLEDIGLEESKKIKEIAAATRRYVGSQDVFKKMQACGDNLTGRAYFGAYRTSFSLEGVPVVNTFVDRPTDILELERALLPQRQKYRQKIFVLHGLGGIGKTQLAVEFARRHNRRFSSVFWLDGRTEDSLKQSIANSASKIPEGQVAEASRTYSAGNSGDIDAVIRDVMGWLNRPDNTDWLLIFDNVDREYRQDNTDPNAYDINRYLSRANHGSVLITTRLTKLAQLGVSWKLNKVSSSQASEIFQNRYSRNYDPVEIEELLSLLEGLPLAISQAAAYLQESGIGPKTYIKLYNQQYEELMESQHRTGIPLQDYPDRSVWTTWTISYNAIRAKNKPAANLLLLWACLDNNDLWYGLLTTCNRYTAAAERLSKWLKDIASNELKFFEAIKLLRSYSLIEDMENVESYTTHPVVHKRALHFQSKDERVELARLAVVVVGLAVPHNSTREYSSLQRRLLPHALICLHWILDDDVCTTDGRYSDPDAISADRKETGVMVYAIHGLGMLYANQGKLGEAEKMYQRALQGYEKALGAEHTSTLNTVNNLGNLYADQGKLGKAEKMYQRALQG